MPLDPTVAGIRISHPGRVVHPDLRVTKRELAEYYARIGHWILPHVQDRPLTLVHCPQGVSGPCRYMKHSKLCGPDALRRISIQEKTKIGDYLVADTVPAIVALAQMGIMEVHTWNSSTRDLERPNRIVWDLDPGPQVAWPQVIEGAHTVRAVLEALGLASWVKTTGGRGLHVVVPIKPRLDWSACLAFSRGIAETISKAAPGLYTTSFVKRGRESKILIDYLRNNRTNTSIAAYSTRARSGAPVSVPVRWSELTARLRPETFTVKTILRRLSRLREDPWADYLRSAQRIGPAVMRAATASRRLVEE